jgi:hypothetical protein
VRLWFDVHRALGLWGLPVALLLSVTGAMMVFKDSSRALVGAVWRLQPAAQIARADAPTDTGVLPPDALVARGEAVFPGARWSRLSLPARPGRPGNCAAARRARADTGNTRVRLGADGRLLSVQDPLHSALGNRVLDWVFPLHSAEALGGLARLLWTVFGLLPAVLLGSAAWLWWRRGRQRRAALGLQRIASWRGVTLSSRAALACTQPHCSMAQIRRSRSPCGGSAPNWRGGSTLASVRRSVGPMRTTVSPSSSSSRKASPPGRGGRAPAVHRDAAAVRAADLVDGDGGGRCHGILLLHVVQRLRQAAVAAAGKARSRMASPCTMVAVRSMQFCSSRTLPGQ